MARPLRRTRRVTEPPSPVSSGADPGARPPSSPAPPRPPRAHSAVFQGPSALWRCGPPPHRKWGGGAPRPAAPGATSLLCLSTHVLRRPPHAPHTHAARHPRDAPGGANALARSPRSDLGFRRPRNRESGILRLRDISRVLCRARAGASAVAPATAARAGLCRRARRAAAVMSRRFPRVVPGRRGVSDAPAPSGLILSPAAAGAIPLRPPPPPGRPLCPRHLRTQGPRQSGLSPVLVCQGPSGGVVPGLAASAVRWPPQPHGH